MTSMFPCAVFLNGPIHSGKTTVGRLVAEALAGGLFLDGDELANRADRTFEEWIDATVEEAIQRALQLSSAGKVPIIAYPLRDEDWDEIAPRCVKERVTPICITLAPALEVALANRGERSLEAWELQRIRQMYREGYHERHFSALTLDNGHESAPTTAQKVADFLRSLQD